RWGGAGSPGRGLISAKRAAQPLYRAKQSRIILDDPVGPSKTRHRSCHDPAARGQRDEAVENHLVALAKHPLGVVRADPEIERTVTTFAIVIDDMTHQDEA